MSTRDQEARALDDAWRFLLDLSSGNYRFETVTKLREDARRVAKHYPLAVGYRWTTGDI